ncbi:MAG: hypothetical protein MI919_23430, partial [Holophagales bacterium]|nr:hypothetical protein [Holophagales bacterium]
MVPGLDDSSDLDSRGMRPKAAADRRRFVAMPRVDGTPAASVLAPPIPAASIPALSILTLAILAVPTLVPTPVSAATEVRSSDFGGLRAREIGPAVMSGRISSLDAVASKPVKIYAGSASGGVWRSEDGGTTFEPIFDEHTQSIGAVRLDPSNPEIVWVGTGESWTRNSVSIGDGVYKSTDGGDTWSHVGLEDTERIGAIRIHPEKGDVVYVCATGHLFADHEARGLYKTTDGGETWNRILYVDERTGCADIDIDPQEPDILYAAMWQFRRWGHFFESGGPGSGLYRTTDGGETWEEIREGL